MPATDPLRVLVAGGGIGGLSAALCVARAGHKVQVFEKAPQFAEVGAGIQLGPNATRILQAWGLGSALQRVACQPEALVVHDAASGQVLGRLPLGDAMRQRYGAPYLTVHRAALHGLLLDAVRKESQSGQAQIELHPGWALAKFEQDEDAVHTTLQTQDSKQPVRHGDVLIAAHGLWSLPRQSAAQWSARQGLGQDGVLHFTGHWAWRALLELPTGRGVTGKESDVWNGLAKQVNVWLAPHMHAVAYPVRDLQGGVKLNLVVAVESDRGGEGDGTALQADWGSKNFEQISQLPNEIIHSQLQNLLLEAGLQSGWQRWPLFAIPPLKGPAAMHQGRVARLGDAAHPMLPYLAQGAGMAIEDAAALGAAMAPTRHPENMLEDYANARWRRNARVQAKALQNSKVFHADGLLRWGRDLAMRSFGARLLDQPWLYGS